MNITQVKNRWFVAWHGCRFAWLQYMSILEAYDQRDELGRLMRWAQRKRLTGVHLHYQRLLGDVEMRLFDRALRHPRIARLADWAYCAHRMLYPAPDISERRGSQISLAKSITNLN